MGPARALDLHILETGPAEIDETFVTLYRDNGYQPFWIEHEGPGKQAQDIRDVLSDAGSHGLEPSRYLLNSINLFWNSSDAADLVRLDILLSMGMARYVADMREGRLNPRRVEPELFDSAGDLSVDLKALFASAGNAVDMKTFLEQQEPPFPQYRLLKEKLAEYRLIAASGGWPSLPVGKTLKAGMNEPGIELLRQRLILTGDLGEQSRQSTEFDQHLLEAVRHFQNRHNLSADGIVGKQTAAAMNVPVHERIQQLVINMERYRWLKHRDEERSVIVNIAGFELLAGNCGTTEISMPVIVGKTYHKTPVFNGMISYVEFNPYWNIPPSIARNEILPQLKKDPLYLKKNNMRIFRGWEKEAPELDSAAINWRDVSKQQMNSYVLRQDPGPDNALGLLKIMFPNKHNVYLHDTPSRELFSLKQRALSHGCIRMARPAEMAAWVLGGAENGWSEKRVNEIIATGRQTVVALKQHIPVCILYRTAYIRPEDKTLHFYEDIYGRDSLLAAALQGS
ncbi:MAG: L,D-transpeptidase family protein [Desulfocapsaceae bacterium]|jgi:murein L,D-transpeptidase YcbB/YkuD|nr:L,D-transpeptidase family protein [Desulfocapsaceae bacterium]